MAENLNVCNKTISNCDYNGLLNGIKNLKHFTVKDEIGF